MVGRSAGGEGPFEEGMGQNSVLLMLPLLLLFAVIDFGSAASANGYAFEERGSSVRNLLQATKSCPLNFEFMNYTVITSKCKGPQYPPKLCCKAFKEFACPYADEINDGTNDCATTMFSYINLYGKYPPGLFASECREGKEGLECPANATTTTDNGADPGHLARRLSHFPMMVAGFMLIFLFL